MSSDKAIDQGSEDKKQATVDGLEQPYEPEFGEAATNQWA
jgi:hypothetical protein